jgi:hypothetical protein
MTRLFGFTTILGNEHVVAFGSRCFVWYIYMFKVPHRRKKVFWLWYMADAGYIVHHLKYNSCGNFRFFGYVSIDENDLRDE